MSKKHLIAALQRRYGPWAFHPYKAFNADKCRYGWMVKMWGNEVWLGRTIPEAVTYVLLKKEWEYEDGGRNDSKNRP
jgi:hypothetical protein